MLDPTTIDQASRGEESTTEQLDGAITTDHALVEDELLVEEISIDGMCGVY